MGGIGSSNGDIYDFQGPFTVGKNNLAFGRPLKYVPLQTKDSKYKYTKKQWDEALAKANCDYNKMVHIICWNNCHNHVAQVLNYLNYEGKSNYTMVHIWWMRITRSIYVDKQSFFKTYIGFVFCCAVYLLM